MDAVDRRIAKEETLVALIEEMTAGPVSEARAFEIATIFIGIGVNAAVTRPEVHAAIAEFFARRRAIGERARH